ncbi:hypothetical protein QCN29_35535, partial [Streptomyces sp. HNM0663]
ALPADADGGQPLTGTGRVTLLRTGGDAGFGAYTLLYTTRPVPGGGAEAIVAAARPEDTDPVWELHRPQRYGPQTSEKRPLMRWAAALETDRRKVREPGRLRPAPRPEPDPHRPQRPQHPRARSDFAEVP